MLNLKPMDTGPSLPARSPRTDTFSSCGFNQSCIEAGPCLGPPMVTRADIESNFTLASPAKGERTKTLSFGVTG